MFEQMSKTRFARVLIPGPHVIQYVHQGHRCGDIFMYNNPQSVGQMKSFEMYHIANPYLFVHYRAYPDKGVQVKESSPIRARSRHNLDFGPGAGGKAALKDAFDMEVQLLERAVPLYNDNNLFADRLQNVLIGLDIVGEIIINGQNDLIHLNPAFFGP